MKVIKEGKWNVPWTGNHICPTCSAELLVEEADVKPVDYGSGYFCSCPCCSKSIPIDGKDLCLRLKEALDRKRKYSSGSGRD